MPSSEIEITLLDISATGCKIRTVDALAQIGATILIRLSEDHEFAGEIVWRDQDYYGIKFHREVSIETLDWIAAWQH